jgi:O-antigen/teichoic acid export membrane protein
MLVAWNTTAQIIGKCITGTVTFLFSILIARSFGPVGYGDFTKITIYVAFFYLVSDFGINAIYLQKNKTSSPTAWGVLLGLRLVGSVALSFIALSLLAFLPQGTSQGYTTAVRLGIIFFVPSIVSQAIITSANATFQKHLRYDVATVAVSVGSILSLVLLWVFSQILNIQVGAFASVCALLSGSIVSALIALGFVKKLGTPLLPVFDPKQLQSLLTAALPLGLTLLFNVVYFRVDSIILTLTRSTAEVGLYGFAYKLFELPLVIPTFFMNAMYPLFLAATPDRFFHLIKRSFVLLFAGSLVLLIFSWYLSPLVVLIRPDFGGSSTALRILSLGIPFFFLSSLTMWALIARGHQKLLAGIYGSSMVITVLLDIFFIPKGGYVSASWITVVSEALVFCISGVILLYQLTGKESQ